MTALGRHVESRTPRLSARLAAGQAPPAVGDVLLIDPGAVRVRRVYGRTVFFDDVNVRSRALLGADRWELSGVSGRSTRVLRRM